MASLISRFLPPRAFAMGLWLMVSSSVGLSTTAVEIEIPPSFFISGGGVFDLGEPFALTTPPLVPISNETYVWRKDDAVIAGATGKTYVVPAASAADAGIYTVTVTTASGSSSASAEVKVKAAASPAIAYVPPELIFYVGQQAQINYPIAGSHPRTYQWRKNGIDVPGATDRLYQVPAVTKDDEGDYSVVVSNAFGTVTSPVTKLIVLPPILPKLLPNYPQDVTVTQFQDFALQSYLSEGTAPLSYQWYKNGSPVAGATSEELKLTSAALADAGKYSVLATNPAGGIRSREATVTIHPAVPVSIDTPPQSRTVVEGQSLTLNVSHRGSTPLTYQWLKNGSPVPGATFNTLYFGSAKVSDTGTYVVVVTNGLGAVTSSAATLTVNPAIRPAIATQPVNLAVPEGEWGSFTVGATGSEPLTYRWYLNEKPVEQPVTAGFQTLYFSAVDASDAGTYRVEVKNAGGTAVSQEVTLTVLPPVAPRKAEIWNVSAARGSNTSLEPDWWSVSPGQTYQWFKDGQPIPGARSPGLSIADVQPPDVGDYFVLVSNSAGATPSYAGRVTMLARPDVSGWVATRRRADIVYFARANPGRIERYDLAAEAWLPTIPLSSNPLALAIAGDALYVSFGTRLARLNLEGINETSFGPTFAGTVLGLELENDLLVAHDAPPGEHSQITLLRLTDGANVASRKSLWDDWAEVITVPTINRIISRTAGVTPSSIYYSEVKADGSLGATTKGPYHGGFPAGKRLIVSSDEKYFADDSGVVYNTSDLKFAGSLGGAFDDVAFAGGQQAMVLRGGVVHIYSDFIETGRLDTGFAGGKIFAHGNSVFVFGSANGAGAISCLRTSLAQARPIPAAAPEDARGLSFTPDEAFMDRDGVLFLVSKSRRQLFRWSPAERTFLPPIPLQSWPSHVAYSASSHRLYLAYGDSRVTQVRLDAGAFAEEPFFTTVQRVETLATAGEFVLVSDRNRYSSQCWTFILAPDGRMTSVTENDDPSFRYEWSPTLRRLYHFRDWFSPNDLKYTPVSAVGAMDRGKDSRYHGNVELVPRYPIRLTPDSKQVLLGSGQFYDAETLSLVRDYRLANRVDDATWLQGRLYTARPLASGLEIQRWGASSYGLDRSVIVPGRGGRIFPLGNDRLLVVAFPALRGPTFTFLDPELTPPTSAGPAITLTDQSQSQPIAVEKSAVLSVANGLGSYTWQKNGAPISGAAGATFSIGSVQPGDAGLYTAQTTDLEKIAVTTPAILGITSLTKIVGTGSETGSDIVHPDGNIYDQLLLQGEAVSVTADPGQVLRLSYVDLSNDIVQVEFSGAGTLSLTLDYATPPAPPTNYIQPGVNYVQGHASIVIADADETTHISVFTVGAATAINQSLFISGLTYDGVADLAYIAIHSRNGKFGSLRAGNASFLGIRGITGLYAPGITFQGPVCLRDIYAVDLATPYLALAGTPDLRITGGSLAQGNGAAVQVASLVSCRFTDGTNSHGRFAPAQTNRARFERNGLDVTSQIVVNPTP